MTKSVRTVDDILHDRCQDTLFLHFENHGDGLGPEKNCLEAHIKWFRENGIEYEPAEIVGYKDSSDYCYAVYFESPDDPRIQEYANKFETADFKSLEPENYQMYLYNYVFWYSNGGKDRMEAKAKQ
jgi:hypothetical protein